MRSAKHLLYFALQPPPEAAAQALAVAEDARRRYNLSGKPSAAGRLHVSLINIGEFKRPPGPVVNKAIEAAQPASTRPFRVEFNRVGTWPAGDPPRPIVLWGDEGVIGVHALHAVLHKALMRFDMVPRRPPPLEPHMTLLYDTTHVDETLIPPVGWQVREFVLIHAVHGEGRHDVVARFPLSG